MNSQQAGPVARMIGMRISPSESTPYDALIVSRTFYDERIRYRRLAYYGGESSAMIEVVEGRFRSLSVRSFHGTSPR